MATAARLNRRVARDRGPGATARSQGVLRRAARAALQEGLLLPALHAFCRLEVSGLEHACGQREPLLIAATHASHLDTLAVLAALPAAPRRRVAVAAAADYFFHSPLLGAAVELAVNAFPFARQRAAPASLRACGAWLAAGWSVLLYPEGTRAVDGRIAPFRSGVGLLAVESGAPVLPTRIEGTARALPKGRWLPRPGPVRVIFGAPLRFAPETPPAVAARAIEAAVRELAASGQ